jgi:glutamine synthetase
VLRASIASANNDHRLGANEAPPAIISVFIGDYLTKLLDGLEKNIKGAMSPSQQDRTEARHRPHPAGDAGQHGPQPHQPLRLHRQQVRVPRGGQQRQLCRVHDRAEHHRGPPAAAFKKSVDALIKKGVKKDEAVLRVIRDLIVESKAIRFEGNGYGDEWKKEAAKRGLSNIADTPRALDVWSRKETKELFADMGVLSEVELEARHEIELHSYVLKIQIEGRVCGDLAQNHIVPTAISLPEPPAGERAWLREVLRCGKGQEGRGHPDQADRGDQRAHQAGSSPWWTR